MNKVTICGYLGRDFEFSYTENQQACVRTHIAVSEKRRNKDTNEITEYTDWLPIVIFGKKAEIANQYLKCGDRFLGEGRISTYSYINQSGIKSYGWHIIINNFEFIHEKRNNENMQPQEQNYTQEQIKHIQNNVEISEEEF
ncbi:single-stranded DNA-binding protein [Campylobacter lari]|uniref:single-stranded DNA-binding protein n=1 Tax=Campylobacter lari TaxID=201 RepID=UPI00087590BE|nr:single-stranded DNA-binding protein [Campylobacter lari]EAK0768211.1 single-stranded DNA-binding protein [Campylobacter lari]EDP6895645.1 single-stranded DNA-binding protein [Campylobacter lari]MCV3399060.1 single-stranded DNA-binding protein [Campylobacter lari]MCV3414626.1 single-stranded DNA-binding protein [Campylobacter lari]MCV3481811.1 single-stranded DNA-binding protein [Campylobacter lari]